MMCERSIKRERAIDAWLPAHRAIRIGRPAEIGAAAAYLVSGQAEIMPGTLLDIDGGATRALKRSVGQVAPSVVPTAAIALDPGLKPAILCLSVPVRR